MCDVSSLPAEIREVVENFVARADFWKTVPGEERPKFWETDNPDRPYASYTAFDVVQFTKRNCLAVTGFQSELMAEFLATLQADWAMVKKKGPLETVPLADILSNYIMWIDRIFFFGLLFHPEKSEGKMVPGRMLFSITLHAQGLKYTDGQWLYGVFQPIKGKLSINLLETDGQTQSFEKALCIALHELSHAYLHILSREFSAAGYHKALLQNKGHGVQFYELFTFLLYVLKGWMPEMKYVESLAEEMLDNLDMAVWTAPRSDAIARSCMSS